MKMKLLLAAITAFCFTISSADAQVTKRAKNQHQRIKEGVQSGELTKAEAANLRTDQKEIRQDVKDARADGVVTRDERKEVKQEQRQENRKIFRKKHNERTRH
jgi:hypothetical protein